MTNNIEQFVNNMTELDDRMKATVGDITNNYIIHKIAHIYNTLTKRKDGKLTIKSTTDK